MGEPLNLPTDILLATAERTAGGIAAAVAGKPADSQVIFLAEMVLGVTALIEQLSRAVADGQAARTRQEQALTRIARLDIRGATELLELGAWRKVAGELQAIAQDAICQPRQNLKQTERDLGTVRDAGTAVGLSY